MTTPADFTNLEPTEFARLVAAASDAELQTVMESERRAPVLGEIFGRFASHFRAERATGFDAVVHFKIAGRPGGGEDHWEVVVHDGTCAVHSPPEHDPGVTVMLAGIDFLKLVSGNADGTALFIGGKLKLQGDVMLAARMLALFAIPKA